MQEPGRRLLCLLQRLRQPRTKNLRGPRRGGGAKPGFQQPHLERISRLPLLPPRAVPSAEPHARPGRRRCRSGQRRRPRAHGCAGQRHTMHRRAHGCRGTQHTRMHACTGALACARMHIGAHGCRGARWQSSAGAERPSAGRHGARRSGARGRLLRLQPTPPPADTGHGRAQSRGPSTPEDPSPKITSICSALTGRPAVTLLARPKETQAEPALPRQPLSHAIPAPRFPGRTARARHRHSSITRAGPAARGCQAELRPVLRPRLPISQADCSCRCRAQC